MRSLGTLLQVVSLLAATLVHAAPPEPAVGTPVVFAGGLDGPEGIAFTKKR